MGKAGGWVVSGLPRRWFSRNHAITAMVLAEQLATGYGECETGLPSYPGSDPIALIRLGLLQPGFGLNVSSLPSRKRLGRRYGTRAGGLLSSLDDDPGEFDAGAYGELAEYLAQVERHGVDADVQLAGDLPVVQSLGDQLGHGALGLRDRKSVV